jgi:hypothetical protein
MLRWRSYRRWRRVCWSIVGPRGFGSVLVRCWTFWYCYWRVFSRSGDTEWWVVTLHLSTREVRPSAASPLPGASFPGNVPPVPMTRVDPRGGMGKVANRRMTVWREHNPSSDHFTEPLKVLLSRERERERVTLSLTCCHFISFYSVGWRWTKSEDGAWQNDTKSETPNHSWTVLFHCQFVHHKSHMDWPGIEAGPVRWGTRNMTKLMNYCTVWVCVCVCVRACGSEIWNTRIKKRYETVQKNSGIRTFFYHKSNEEIFWKGWM